MILINSSPKDALKIFQPFLPIFVPVGIGCLLAEMERRGVKTFLIDEQVEDFTLDKVAEYVREMEKPYIFGFSVLTAAFKSAITVSRELKRLYPESLVVFGGIHPTAMPEEVLSYDHIDLVLKGEGEKGLVELYRCIKEGRDYHHIDNISYRKDGQIVHNRMSFYSENLDDYPPFPYHRFTSNRYDLGFVLSSRGCPYRCIFCSNRVTTGRRYRYRSSASIVEELKILHEKYGKRYILFLDDNLLVNKERIYSLFEAIRGASLDKVMTFNFQARGDNVDRKLLEDLHATGFRSIFFGLETSSEEIMKTIRKGETVAQCMEAARLAKEIGFHVSATFIYALPGETHQDRMNCVKMSTDLELDMVRYNNATPYPGTELHEIAGSEGRLNVQGLYENFNSVSTFIENPFKRIPFSYVPPGNTENEIRRDILFSYFRFYFDIKRLKNVFARPDQGVGWFNAGEKMWDFAKKVPSLLMLSAMMFFKFSQFIYYCAMKKETRISLHFPLKVFEGLFRKGRVASVEP